MRNNLWFLVLTACTLGFAACSSDKSDQTIAEKVAGTYAGTITVTQENGTSLGNPMENQKIYITSTGINIVTLELKDFKFDIIPVGDLKVTNVIVAEDGSLSGSASQVPIMEGAIKADLTLSGNIQNNKADLLILVNAPLAPDEDPMVMRVTFLGNKQN